MVGSAITVIKRNLAGEETWRYPGKVLEVLPNGIILEAFFNLPDAPFHDILLGQGDRFVETYYTDRWYNIFEMYAREDGALKGWYCNICLPVEIEAESISWVDLALDLLVYPDGKQLILDEDEFAALPLTPQQREKCLEALAALQRSFHGCVRV